MNKGNGRNELKFIISKSEAKMIDFRMSSILEKDSHVNESGFYEIKSLYFDDDKFTNAFDVETGSYIKKKYRIRCYGTNNNNKLYLECKQKRGTICYKESTAISLDDYYCIISGDYTKYVYKDNELLKRFAVDKMIKNLNPKLIIQYDRIPYVEYNSNTRITIDYNIKASVVVDDFLSNDASCFAIQENNSMLLEVKYDEVIPRYISNLLDVSCLSQTSFSKYYLGFEYFNGGNTKWAF